MLNHAWDIRRMAAFTDYMLLGTKFFVARPHGVHARVIGLPRDCHYAVYESGADPSGCAARRGIYRTLKEAKAAAIAKAEA